MVGIFTNLVCTITLLSYASGLNTDVEGRLSEKLRLLEEKLEQQEIVIAKQGETLRRLEQTCHQEIIRNGVQADHENRIQHLEHSLLKDRIQRRETNSDNYSMAGTISKTQNAAPTLDRVARQTERVAFSSYVDHNLKNLGIDQPIVYNRVLLNEGSAYNEHSGTFTCPMDGIYAFYFTVSTVDINQIVAKLVVDGVNQVDGVSDTYHDNHEAQGGNFVVLSLQKGQQVWVANYRWTINSRAESDTYRFSTFSGFFLY